MNANELADELMKCSIPRLFYLDELMNNAAIMLRQQQAEIEALNELYLDSKADVAVLQATVNNDKEVIADWETEVNSLKNLNRLYRDQIRQQQAEIELLQAKLNYMFEQELKSARVNR